jgi:chaperonin cofactor prefoldin
MNQQLHIQKQQLRREQVELQSALEQLEDNPETYSMIGSLMIQQDAVTVKEKLSKKLEDVKKQLVILDEQINESRTNA